jgi:hypothetical protein
MPRASLRAALILLIFPLVCFAAAALDLGMEHAWGNATPRVNPLTIGLASVTLPAAAFVIFLWSAPRRSGAAAAAGRVVGTLGAIAIAGASASAALFLMSFVG